MKKENIKKTIPKEEKDFSMESIWQEKKGGRGQKNSAALALSVIALILVVVLGVVFVANITGGGDVKERERMKVELEDAKKKMTDDVDTLQTKLAELQKRLNEKEEAESDIAKTNAKPGFIEGSLSFSSNYIPKDMKVCAIDIKTEKETCTTEQLFGDKYTYNVGYKLELPVGTYTIYSSTESQAGYQAYYSEYVTCGLKYNCPSHEPIEVKVESEKTLSEIDPIDWYKK